MSESVTWRRPRDLRRERDVCNLINCRQLALPTLKSRFKRCLNKLLSSFVSVNEPKNDSGPNGVVQKQCDGPEDGKGYFIQTTPSAVLMTQRTQFHLGSPREHKGFLKGIRHVRPIQRPNRARLLWDQVHETCSGFPCWSCEACNRVKARKTFAAVWQTGAWEWQASFQPCLYILYMINVKYPLQE